MFYNAKIKKVFQLDVHQCKIISYIYHIMKLAHFFKTAVPDIKWDLCLQMGVKYAVAKLSPELTGKDPIWHYSVLEQAKESFALTSSLF